LKVKSLIGEITVLYAEDDSTTREILKLKLLNRVKNIIVAKDGAEGLNLFVAHKDEIDVVITDIKMPYMDGIQMAKCIRDTKPSVKVVYVTANSDADNILAAIQAGANAYIATRLRELANTVESDGYPGVFGWTDGGRPSPIATYQLTLSYPWGG
jgi:CheY-like chemotaxis protein